MPLPDRTPIRRRGRRTGALVATLTAVALASLAVPAAAGSAAYGAPAPKSSATEPEPTSLVNPFIGTKNEGFDFPAVGEPFGMVQEVPMVLNRAGAGGNTCDSDSAEKIYGFSHITFNGCRFNYAPFMPTTGAITSTNPSTYASSFNRAQEQVHPDSYDVHLDKYDTDVELASTTRTGWQRYTFPRTSQANVLFNTGKNVSESEIQIVGDRTIEGWVRGEQKAYFVAELSRPFTAYGTWKNGTLAHDSRTSTNSGDNGGWVSFDTTKDDAPVVVKVGWSYTGTAGARRNLDVETGSLGYDFDAVQGALHDRWDTTLRKAEISGGTHDQQVEYYTALYHSVLSPNVVGDVDGRYMGTDDAVHKAKGYTQYGVFSLWDTYRTQNQLVELLDPKVAHDADMSLVAIARDGGALPRWFLGNKDGNIMTGDPVTPFLVEGWSKGLFTDAEAKEVYKYVRKNATEVPGDGVHNGRAAVDQYASLGYIPYGLHVSKSCPTDGSDASCCPTAGNDNDCYYPASTQLEYAAADASLALMAQGLGHTADAKMFAARGQSYRNIFDKSVGTFRPRTADGTWVAPFDTKTGDHAFHESGPYQYQWLVPQDPAGLVSMLGGRQAATNRLDEFFAYPDLLTDPVGTAKDKWIGDPYGYYGFTTYQPDNEPNLLAPYLYAWTGRPDKTATVVRAQQTLFTNSPTGMTGNDDMGEMSAWYVMSALGLYPTMSGSNTYVVTTPLFPKATLRIGSYGKTQGGTLKISAPGASMSKRYIATASVNGKDRDKSWVSQADIAHGGTIKYALSTSPTSWARSAKSAPPSVNKAVDVEPQLGASVAADTAVVTPTAKRASTQDVDVTVLATAEGNATVKVSAAAPRGWKVSPRTKSVKVSSNGLPTQAKVSLAVTAPAGTAAGTYDVTVTARTAGASAVRHVVHVKAQPAGACATQTDTSCAVDLSAAYDRDGVATADAPTQGNIDGLGYSYAADQLPAAGPTTIGGVTYQAPSTAGTDKNLVEADGQTIALPQGSYGALQVLGAAVNGGTGILGGTAVATYTDGTTASVPLQFTDWGKRDLEFGNTAAITMPYRMSTTGKNNTQVSIYRATVALDASKTVRSLTLPRSSVPEWTAPGLVGTAWDHDSGMEIYAMTLQGTPGTH
ncbi:GH92 family glycosyl hydrolase [Luteimicrobium sp. NPDC057192]|uniref:GH92 family glycosyl hydrolase n=1 Tax=Luteimicrobium sp. NPDC057192 TaxID=3346042 RepID=UPI00362A5A70